MRVPIQLPPGAASLAPESPERTEQLSVSSGRIRSMPVLGCYEPYEFASRPKLSIDTLLEIPRREEPPFVPPQAREASETLEVFETTEAVEATEGIETNETTKNPEEKKEVPAKEMYLDDIDESSVEEKSVKPTVFPIPEVPPSSESEVPLSPEFVNLLRCSLVGQDAFDRALALYVPRPGDELIFKSCMFHFYCKDLKSAHRRPILDSLSLPFAKCLESISRDRQLQSAHMKRGSSARISAFCQILRKMGLPPVRDPHGRIVKTDKLTHTFLFDHVRRTNLHPQIQQELNDLEGLKRYFLEQFDSYFLKRIPFIVSDIRKAASKTSPPQWKVSIPARMILAPIDFDSSLMSIQKLLSSKPMRKQIAPL